MGGVRGAVLPLVLPPVVLVLWLAGVVRVSEGWLGTEDGVPLPAGVVVALTEVPLCDGVAAEFEAGPVARDEVALWTGAVAELEAELVTREEVAPWSGEVARLEAGPVAGEEVTLWTGPVARDEEAPWTGEVAGLEAGPVAGEEVALWTGPVSYTHLTLPTRYVECIYRWSPYH